MSHTSRRRLPWLVIALATISALFISGLVAPPASRAAAGDVTVTLVDSLTNKPISVGGWAELYLDTSQSGGAPVLALVHEGVVSFPSTGQYAGNPNLGFRVLEPISAQFGPLYKPVPLTPISGPSATVGVQAWLGSFTLAVSEGGVDTPQTSQQITLVDRETRERISGDSVAQTTDSNGRFGFDLDPGEYMLQATGQQAQTGNQITRYPMAFIPLEIADIGGVRTLIDGQNMVNSIRRFPASVVQPKVVAGQQIPVEVNETVKQYAGSAYLLDDSPGTLSRNGQYWIEASNSPREVVIRDTVNGTTSAFDIDSAYTGAARDDTSVWLVSNDATRAAWLRQADDSILLTKWDLTQCDDSVTAACEIALPALDDGGVMPFTQELQVGLTGSGDLGVMQATIATVDVVGPPRAKALVFHSGGVTSSGLIYGGRSNGYSCGVLRSGATAASGAVTAISTVDASCDGHLWIWRASNPDAFSELVPQESAFGDTRPHSLQLSPSGNRIAMVSAVPGAWSNSDNIVMMRTDAPAPVEVALIDDTGLSIGELGGVTTGRALAVTDDDTVIAWISPQERSNEGSGPFDPPTNYGIEETGNSILEIAPVIPGNVPYEFYNRTADNGGDNGGGGGGGGDNGGGGGGGGGGGEPEPPPPPVLPQLPKPTVTVSAEYLGTSGQLKRGTTVTVVASAQGATAALGSLECGGCSRSLTLDFQQQATGNFRATATLPMNARTIEAVSVSVLGTGFRENSARASGLPLFVSSTYAITLAGRGVGAEASEQLRTSRLVAMSNGFTLPYVSPEIGTSTRVVFDVPQGSDGVRLVTKSGETLGTIALAALAGQESAGTLEVKERTALRVEVPQMKATPGVEPPFAYYDIVVTALAPDGAVAARADSLGPSGTFELGLLPAPETYTITAQIQRTAFGKSAASFISSEPLPYLLQPGAEGQVRTATVNLRPVPTGPVEIEVLTRRVADGAEGDAKALPQAEVRLVGVTRPDGVRLTQSWEGQTDDSGLVSIEAVPAGTYRVQVRGGRSGAQESLTIPAPGERERLTVKASSYEPITAPFIIRTGVRPGQDGILRAEWRNIVHYGVNLSGHRSRQLVPAPPGVTTRSGDMIIDGPGEFNLCGSGVEANVPGRTCVKFAVDVNGKTFIIGEDGSRTEGVPTLRLVPAAAIEIPAIEGLGKESIAAARVSVNGADPTALLPWLVVPVESSEGSAAAARSGLVSLREAGDVVLTLVSTGGRVSTTSLSIADGEVAQVTPRFASEDDILGTDSQIITPLDPVVPGGLPVIRVNVRAGEKDLPDALLALDLPPGISVVPASVTVDGVPQPEATTAVSLGALKAKQLVGVSFKVDVAETIDGPQSLTVSVTSDGKTQAIPGAYLSVGGITLVGPSSSHGRTVLVSGRTSPSAEVEIINSVTGDTLGRAIAVGTGFYQASVELPAVPSLTTFTLVARVAGREPEVRSRPISVKYDPTGVQITSLTLRQVNPNDPNDTRELTGDPRQGVIRAPFVWVPGHVPSVSFTVDDPRRVRRALVSLGEASVFATRGPRNTFVATFPSNVDAGPIDIKIESTQPATSNAVSGSEGQLYARLPATMQNPQGATEATSNGFRTVLGWTSAQGGLTGIGMTVEIRPAPAGAKAGVVAFPNSPYEDGRMVSPSGTAELIVDIPWEGDPLQARTSGTRAGVGSRLWRATMKFATTDGPDAKSITDLVDPKKTTWREFGQEMGNGLWAAGFTADAAVGAGSSFTDNSFSSQVSSFIDDVVAQCPDPDKQRPLLKFAEKILGYAYWGTVWYGITIPVFTLSTSKWIPGLGKVIDAASAYGGHAYDNALGEWLDLARSKLLECQVENNLKIKLAQRDAARFNPPDEPASPALAVPTFIYDPSGYVYEAVRSNRVKGATATLYDYTGVPDGGEPIKWDAIPYLQVNDLTTNAKGRYGWDVPPGLWRVQITKPGYQDAYSDVVEVLPPQLDVNIPVVSTEDPGVRSVRFARKGAIVVTFSQYMTVDSMKRAVQASANLPGGAGKVTFVETAGAGAGAGLPADPSAPVATGGQTVMLSRTLVLRPSLGGGKALPKGTRITVAIGPGALAYTGKVLRGQPPQTLIR